MARSGGIARITPWRCCRRPKPRPGAASPRRRAPRTCCSWPIPCIAWSASSRSDVLPVGPWREIPMRLLMRALLASNAILLAALVWTQTRPQPPVSDVLRARLIELVDRHGEMRAQLQVAENGAGELRLRNSKGEIRTKLGASDDGA